MSHEKKCDIGGVFFGGENSEKKVRPPETARILPEIFKLQRNCICYDKYSLSTPPPRHKVTIKSVANISRK